jgi:hypothetical protein
MFAVHCPRHRSRVLLDTSAVDALEASPDGVVVHWRCSCGARGTTPAGSRRSERAGRHARIPTHDTCPSVGHAA